MHAIVEAIFETHEARFHVCIYANTDTSDFTADYYGYTPRNSPPFSSRNPEHAFPKEIWNGNLTGTDVFELVDACRADIERQFGTIIAKSTINHNCALQPARYTHQRTGDVRQLTHTRTRSQRHRV